MDYLKRLEVDGYLNDDFYTSQEFNKNPEDNYFNLNKLEFELTIVNMMKSPVNINSNCYTQRFEVFCKLKEIIRKNKIAENITFFMHGSYAVGEITEFSDIDLGVIIPESITSLELIPLRYLVRDILGYLYSEDPLMHHGIDVFFHEEFYQYDQSRLPVDTLNKSVALNNKGYFEVFVNREYSKRSAKIKLLNQCNAVMSYSDGLINYSAYKQKSLISVVLLIPVLFVQSVSGEFLCKRSSINKFKDDYYDKLPLLAIDMATDLRNEWRVPNYIKNIRNLIAHLEFVFPVLRNTQRISGSMYMLNINKTKEFIRASRLFAASVKEVIDGH